AAEPGVVAHREEDVGVGGGPRHQVLVDDLVADGGGDAQLAGPEQGLPLGAAAEGGHGQVEEADGAPQPALQGHVFAEGHQVALVVLAGPVAEGDHRVVVAVARLGGNAGDQGAAGLPRPLVHPGQVVVDPVPDLGYGGFRPDHQGVVPQGFRLAAVQVEDL